MHISRLRRRNITSVDYRVECQIVEDAAGNELLLPTDHGLDVSAYLTRLSKLAAQTPKGVKSRTRRYLRSLAV